MPPRLPNHPFIAAFIALVVVVLLGVWGYSAYQQRQMRNEVLGMVTSTSERLRATLQAEASPPGASPPAIDVMKNAATAEAAVGRLRGMDTSGMTTLADAADDYLLTAREILRRVVDMHNGRERLEASTKELSQHIQGDRGAASWPEEAVRLRHGLGKDVRDYRIAVESFAALLEKFPASQTKIAPLVDAAVLIDEKLVKEARQSALEAYARTDQNTKQLTQLEVYRGKRPAAPASKGRRR